MRIDGRTIERLAENYEQLKSMLTNYERHVKETADVTGENRQLRERVKDLETRLAAPEWRAREARAVELDKQEANLKALLKLEYDKGYTAAYTEVTNKMRVSS
jgi:regulator of replication initiation timing